MSELRINASPLHEVSVRITAGVSVVRLDASLSAFRADVLGTTVVASPLRDGSVQQAARAELVAKSLREVARYPLSAVTSFSEADAALARAF
ncbi:hypothetical protein [Leifsonia sp. NPDC058230]|uniref:hypothetical protein n=1 Tax=Leifsonia sp. NPDC058230 TaxID=3346391 RepID=UPI0036D8ECA7